MMLRVKPVLSFESFSDVNSPFCSFFFLSLSPPPPPLIPLRVWNRGLLDILDLLEQLCRTSLRAAAVVFVGQNNKMNIFLLQVCPPDSDVIKPLEVLSH